MLYKIKRYIRLLFINEGLEHKKKFHDSLRILHKKFHSGFFDDGDKYQFRPCVNCQKSENLKSLFCTSENFQFVKCNNCEMVIMNPIPSPTVLDKLYNSSEMTINLSGASIKKGVIEKGKEDMEYIKKYISKGKLLDIGTGGGGFLINASKIFEAEGLEINKKHAEIGLEYGLKIHNVYSGDFSPLYNYDVITLLQVIEHLPEPMSVINDAKRLMNSGGYLYIACPNYNSKSMKIFQERHRHVSTFGHINLYSPKTLTEQVEKFGFKIVNLETYYSDIELHDLFYYYLRKKKFSHRMANYNPFVFQFSITLSLPFKEIYERRIVQNDEGSYIRAIFRKQ